MLGLEVAGSRILVEPAVQEDTGRIARPDNLRPDDPDHGTVVGKGPYAPVWISLGDQVVWYPQMGFHYRALQGRGRNLVILTPSDVVAKLIEAPDASS